MLVPNLLNLILLTFFNPSVKLNSGKKIILSGKGPPLFFSTGLFGTMPNFLYSNFLNKLKKKFTIITIDGIFPVTNQDITDIVEELAVDSISYMSHSSFNYNILENDKINNAIIIDPITLPKININGISKRIIKVKYPIISIKASKLYNAEVPLPDWQNPKIIGNITSYLYGNIGHPDILDNRWANLAKKYGFWESSDGKIFNYKNWSYEKNNNNINQIRMDYRNFIYNQTINLIL